MKQISKDKDFSRHHHVLVDKGIWADISWKEAKVYYVIKRFADYTTLFSKVGVRKIVELSGVSKNNIKDTIDKLELRGLLKRIRTPKSNKFRNMYKITHGNQIDTKLALSIIPKKKSRKLLKDKHGRFKSSSVTTDTLTYPLITDNPTCPVTTDKKERLLVSNKKGVLHKTGLSVNDVMDLIIDKGKSQAISILLKEGYDEKIIAKMVKENC